MPRFFFDIYNDRALRDEEGSELADREAAVVEGFETARELLSQGAAEGKDRFSWFMRIRDGAGNTVRDLDFRDVLQPDGRFGKSRPPH